MKSKEKQALVRVLDRAHEDAENYLLGPHAALDYGDEYASILRQNAEDFRKVAQLSRELGLPHSDGGDSCAEQWEYLAARLTVRATRAKRELRHFRIQERGKH